MSFGNSDYKWKRRSHSCVFLKWEFTNKRGKCKFLVMGVVFLFDRMPSGLRTCFDNLGIKG